MPPRLLNDDGDVFVARPPALVGEAVCAAFAAAMRHPIIPCDLRGSQDRLQRMQIKALPDGWAAATPGRRSIMARALTNAQPSRPLDLALWDFTGLTRRAG